MHTLDAVETINRIISVFPPPEQKQVRMQLAATLKAVVANAWYAVPMMPDVSLRVEVLISTAFVRECLIIPEKTRMISEALAAGTSQYGMQTFDQSLYDLYSPRPDSYEVALENASNPDDFKLRVQGIARLPNPPAKRCNPRWTVSNTAPAANPFRLHTRKGNRVLAKMFTVSGVRQSLNWLQQTPNGSVGARFGCPDDQPCD